MKERPILFNGPMVRAILEGRKTQTRRVVKPQPRSRADIGHFGYGMPFIRAANKPVACPYGQPGDRLWVRETWRTTVTDDVDEARRITEDMLSGTAVDYRATFVEDFMREGQVSRADAEECCGFERWRPSIHMPRWASRITLEITGVRVERLQDISEKDSLAEGIRELHLQNNEPGAWWCADPLGNSSLHCRTPRVAFARLWESINGASSWIVNPWVWVVEFERVTP